MTFALPPVALLIALAAFVVAVAMGRPYIHAAQAFKLGQIIREEGPDSHKAKAGTPSMGGWIILAPAVVVLPLFAVHDLRVWLVAVTTVLYAFVGWLDDYLIVKKRSNKGLSPRQKLAGQFLVGVLFAAGLAYLGRGTAITLPVLHGSLDLSYAYYPLLVFIMVGTTNAVNLTDGLDGLASGTVAMALGGLALAVLALVHEPFAPELVLFLFAVIGGCLGFLWYNWHPAQVFMGDTGSLGLGAAFAGAAALAHLELWLVPLGALFIAETVSVMLQVWYFKRTGGKRLFKMSPLHHHFELSGWKETKVVGRFYLIGTFLALLTAAVL